MNYFCSMRYQFLIIITLLAFGTTVQGQEKWSLVKCVEYALTNNISIKQTELQTNTTALQLKQSKMSRLPNLNFNSGPSFSNGYNQDPTTFSLITQSYLSTSFQLQSSAEIFNWFSKRNTIAANDWEVQAAKANVDKLKNDIALSVANSYLQILLAMEQEKIVNVQLQQSQAQLYNTRKLVDAGSLPELNAAELEAQVARDSSTVINSKGMLAQNILNLKALMALDASTPFEVEIAPVDKIPVDKIADLQPESVYALAIANMPQQKFNEFKIKAAQKSMAAAKGQLYPTISVFGGLGSRYNNRSQEIIGSSFITPPIGKVTVNSVDYNVYPLTPYTVYTYGKQPFFSQLNQNFNQSIGLSINVPIFNGYSARSNFERSKVNIRNQQLQKDLDNQSLKQNIYQAYNAAMVALETYNAGIKSMETADRTFNFAQKRYEVGMMSTFELITNQNNLFRAKLQNALNHFDYVFKMKVLEFYKGQGIKL